MSRTNFSEAFQILVHLKVLHLFVESVLRYGLPASYTGFIAKARITPLFSYYILINYRLVYSPIQRQRRKLWKPFRNNLPIWLNAPTPHRPRRASRRVPTTRSSWENTNQCSSKSISTLSFSRCHGSSCKRDKPHWMDLCCTVRTFIRNSRTNIQISSRLYCFLAIPCVLNSTSQLGVILGD